MLWKSKKAAPYCQKCNDTGRDGSGKSFCQDCGQPCNKCKGSGLIEDSYWGDKIKCHWCQAKEPPKSKYKCSTCQDTGIIQGQYLDTYCNYCSAGLVKQTEGVLSPKLVKWEPKYKLDNAEEAIKKKPGNNEIVPAKKNELQLDYDYEEVPEQFHKMLPVLRERFATGNLKWEKYKSSSGKHLHVIVSLPEDITDQERIVWQAVFGSDCMREGISLLRLVAHVNNPSLLFMPVDRVPIDSGVLLPKPGRKFKELADAQP